MREISVTLNNEELATILATLTTIKKMEEEVGRDSSDKGELIRRLLVEKLTQTLTGSKSGFSSDEFFKD